MSTEFSTVLFLCGVAVLIASLWLVAIRRIPVRIYWLPIFIVSFCLVYSLTLWSSHLVGGDINTEHFVSYTVVKEGFWDFTRYYGTQSGMSFVVGWLVPSVANFLNIEVVWVYKAILPMFLVLTPVILFFAFSYMIKPERAFFSAMFFVAVPVFFLESASIGKTMVALFFLSLLIWLMVKDMRAWLKVLLMGLCILGVVLSHYTVGVVLIYFLGAILIIRLIMKVVKWNLFKLWKVSVISIIVLLLVACSSFILVYSKISEGRMLATVIKTIPGNIGYSVKTITEEVGDIKVATEPDVQAPSQPPSSSLPVVPPINPSPQIDTPSKVDISSAEDDFKPPGYMANQEPVIQMVLGFDFMSVSLLGKIFRVLQFFVQIAIVVGCFYLLFRYKYYAFSGEFVVCIGASLLVMECCALLPLFSYTINASRFYQYSLFFLAPMFVLGCEAICNIKKQGNAQ